MKVVCLICNALFINGLGFVEKHCGNCRNNVFLSNWTREVDDDFKRQKCSDIRGVWSTGTWNYIIDTDPKIVEWRRKNKNVIVE